MKNAYLKILAVCAVLGLLTGSPLKAQSSPRFNEIDGQPIHSQADLNALKTGDTVVMTCPACQSSTMVTYSSDPADKGHVNWMQPGFEKTCSCGGKMRAVQVGEKVKLICSKCGDMGVITAFKTASK
jgi:hypothetical protein